MTDHPTLRDTDDELSASIAEILRNNRALSRLCVPFSPSQSTDLDLWRSRKRPHDNSNPTLDVMLGLTCPDIVISASVTRRTPPQISAVKAVVERLELDLSEYACRICLGDMTRTSLAIVVPCFHRFCYYCIRAWLRRSQRCALCQQPADALIYSIRSNTAYKARYFSGDMGPFSIDRGSRFP
uniref:RING-type E3 ubiquitin transferase n=1 Tax=Spongospora subterranea TaxID=70186 RepID=A0A0H5QK39_9EUKA|eukprot:CRZ01987.1 hypothetical protein [Spongospora subterranea]